MKSHIVLFPLTMGALIAGGMAYSCATEAAGARSNWTGTADTLPDGRIMVHNPDAEIWTDETRWTVEEELRIGSLEGTGPDVFGNIAVFEVDAQGRFYIYDRQAMELRVFDRDGAHVRTIGRQGGGPGEFGQVMGITWAPDGNLWVVDPGNNRISVFDTSGAYLTGHRTDGGYMMFPWPGGFDAEGRFYNVGLDPAAEPGDRMVLMRHSSTVEPTDTLRMPRDRGGSDGFEMRSDRGFIRAAIPYQPSLQWRFTPDGFVTLHTGDYRMQRLSWSLDTLLTVTKEYVPLPVTDADIEAAVEGLEWFTNQGGKIDYDKFPDRKPGVSMFFIDDRGFIWAAPVTREEPDRKVFEIFDPDGRYLGELTLPFQIQGFPVPIIRGDFIYGTVRDELEVPYLVRARIHRP